MGLDADRAEVQRVSRDFTAHMLDAYGYVKERPVACHVFRDAVVTKTAYPTPETLTGAVYDGEGRLVRSSQRIDPQWLTPVDPETLPAEARAGAERVPRALYGGMLFLILGHFLFESAARLWPRIDFPAGSGRRLPVLYHPCPGFDLGVFLGMPFLRQGLAALDVEPEDLLIADRTGFVVDRLLYPETLSIYHDYVHPLMSDLLDHLAERILARSRHPGGSPAGPKRVFLSRSKWQLHVRIANEAAIDDAFRAHGFTVVHPQDLAPDEVIGLMRGAEAVASSDGSHAHLLAFARRGTRCFHIDTRPVPTQAAIEKLRGLDPIHVPLFWNPGGVWDEAGRQVDLEKLAPLVSAFAAGSLAPLAP